MHEDDDYTPSRSKSGAALPRVPTSPDFRFGTHPAKWEADIDAGRILPVLVRIDIEAGTHHVGRDGDAVGMERAFRSKGWDILEPDVIGQMPGSEHEYYIKRIRVAGGGLAHLPVWTQALGGSSRILPDEDLHRAFRLYLVDEGLVSLPRPDQMKDAIKRAESSQASNAREADRDPRAKRSAEYWAKVIEVWNKALAEAAPAKASAPTTKGSRKPSTKKVGFVSAEPEAE